MADEVTKKDLRAVQAQLNNKLNNKIAALEKSLNAKIQALVDSTNSALKALNKFDQDSAKFDAEVRKTINQHAVAITELQKNCG
jgi:hypothetical protein